MASGYTIFTTYQFEGASYSASTSYGYQTPIHCNYIQKIETDTLSGKQLNLFFESSSDFVFLAGSGGTANGTGFTATKINALVQVVSGITDSGITISPTATGWIVYDITDQLLNHVIGDPIEKTKLANTLFSVDFNATGETYTLDYLSYPTAILPLEENMAFGEEAYFFGTVRSDIKATVYTTDIPIVLPLNQFNSTTNPTWDGVSSVYITEVGLYDNDGNLVAIGKLNYPISKDSGVARTIVFAVDF